MKEKGEPLTQPVYERLAEAFKMRGGGAPVPPLDRHELNAAMMASIVEAARQREKPIERSKR